MSLDLKKIIAESFLRLCQTKPVRKITVQDIVEESGVSRQSFYNHFPCRDDLYVWIQEWHERQNNMTIDSTNSLQDLIKRHFEVFEKYRRFYRGIISSDVNNPFITHQYNITKAYYMDCIKRKLGNQEFSEELEFTVNFAVYASITVLMEWLLTSSKTSPDEIAQQICDSLPAILWDYVDR